MVFPPPVRDVDGDGGETDNGMKPASMPYTPCGSKEADSERKIDTSTDGIDTSPPPLRQMNEWQHFERGANWLAWNPWTGETRGGVGGASEHNVFAGENKTIKAMRSESEVSQEHNEDDSRQRGCMASADSPYASSGCPWSINTGDEIGSSSSTEGEGDHHTTESPSGGNAVVRGEAGAPMTMAELRDGATHDVEAEEEKKKIAAAHQNHGAQVTQDSLTTVEPGLTTAKEVRTGETKADSAAVNERPSAEVGCGRLHQTFAAYTAAPKRRGCKATLQIVSPPPQQKLSLTQQRRRSVHRAQAAKRARRPTQLLFDQDTLVAKMKEMLAAQDEAAHAAASDGNTKRVRSDKGTRAVQELHGQHPSLND